MNRHNAECSVELSCKMYETFRQYFYMGWFHFIMLQVLHVKRHGPSIHFSHQHSAALAEGDVSSGQVDGDGAHVRRLRLAALLVLGHDGEGRDLGAVADGHQCVGAGAHVRVHDAIEGIVVGVSSHVAHPHTCECGSQTVTLLSCN